MVEQTIKLFIDNTGGKIQPAVLLPGDWTGPVPQEAFAIRSALIAAPMVTGLDVARGLVYTSIPIPTMPPPLPSPTEDVVEEGPKDE
jgi:hypothetical protein